MVGRRPWEATASVFTRVQSTPAGQAWSGFVCTRTGAGNVDSAQMDSTCSSPQLVFNGELSYLVLKFSGAFSFYCEEEGLIVVFGRWRRLRWSPWPPGENSPAILPALFWFRQLFEQRLFPVSDDFAVAVFFPSFFALYQKLAWLSIEKWNIVKATFDSVLAGLEFLRIFWVRLLCTRSYFDAILRFTRPTARSDRLNLARSVHVPA